VIGPPRHAFAVVGHSHITNPAGYRVRPPRGMGGLAGHSVNATSTAQFLAGAIWRPEALGVGSVLRLR
jgi:hypothetical protein